MMAVSYALYLPLAVLGPGLGPNGPGHLETTESSLAYQSEQLLVRLIFWGEERPKFKLVQKITARQYNFPMKRYIYNNFMSGKNGPFRPL